MRLTCFFFSSPYHKISENSKKEKQKKGDCPESAKTAQKDSPCSVYLKNCVSGTLPFMQKSGGRLLRLRSL